MAIVKKISKNPRVPLIIDCALSILRDKGYVGLTMRQVANMAGISLSNLQFYFKNKDELLKGMVDFYFERCVTLLEKYLEISKNLQPVDKIRSIVSFGLEGGKEITELCTIFRELWAIATRNEDVAKHLESYYREYANKLSAVFLTMTVNIENVKNIVSLLLPYFEGYAIIAAVLPLNKEQVNEMLTGFVSSELGLD